MNYALDGGKVEQTKKFRIRRACGCWTNVIVLLRRKDETIKEYLRTICDDCYRKQFELLLPPVHFNAQSALIGLIESTEPEYVESGNEVVSGLVVDELNIAELFEFEEDDDY